MRYTAVDSGGFPITSGAPTPAGEKVSYKYFPRIRCHDCPGKLYTPGPAMTVDNFEVHLKNRQHKERVEERHAKAAGGSSTKTESGATAPAAESSATT
jgi:SWI/SNF-related matrix-associated actin-dependent regulator of chromatin subfamily B protein 1